MNYYLSLIRTKIQQRCGSTRDLLHQIRCTKMGNENKVTPSEFRFILIKFGVILNQAVVDKVFNVFDTDRSGTMDYDEFGMYIMNSELGDKNKADVKEDKETMLRRKLVKCINYNTGAFKTMGHHLNYAEFVAFIAFLPKAYLSEKEAKSLFSLLTKGNMKESIDTQQLKKWAQGDVYLPMASLFVTADSTLSLQEAMKREFGTNRGIIFQCFKNYIDQGKVLISFEEFRKCLLSQGHGLDIKAAMNLFLAFGGASGFVSTDVILSSAENTPLISKSHLETKPRTCNRVNELLREAMRKCYRELLKAFHTADPGNTGLLNIQQMHDIINQRCLPLTHLDFRSVLKQVK